MPATVNVNRLAIHMPNLKVGSLYSLAGFDVTRCNQNYRLSDSSMMVRFSDSTCFDEITEPAIPIDIIGEITAAKSTVTDPPHDKNRLMATIKMDNDVSVTMSMFDSQPVKLHNQLESMGCDPRVLVATSINPKIVGGNHRRGDFYRLVAQDTGLKGYDKVESLSIADLNEFVNSTSSQEIDFICTEKVTGIKLDKGWCYVSCSNCTKKLQRTVSGLSAFTCLDCNNTNAVGVLKTDVCSICSHHETVEGLFVCFDVVMTKLHNMRAYEACHLLAPPSVADMEGKTYKFQVKVSAYNFTENHQIFTISCILSEGDRMPLPQFVANGGDDDNGDDNSGAISVRVKVETGGISQVQGSSGIKKKARTA
ncbi:hypothetical protein YC2023_069941 [Brassica napus]